MPITFSPNLTRSELLILLSALDEKEERLVKTLKRMEQEGSNRDKIDLITSYKYRTRAVRNKLTALAVAKRINPNPTN